MLPQRPLSLILLHIEILRLILMPSASELAANLLECLGRYTAIKCLSLDSAELEDVFSVWWLAGEEFVGPCLSE